MTTYQTIVQDAGKLLVYTTLKEGERVSVIVETEHELEEKRLRNKKLALELFHKLQDEMENNEYFQTLSEDEIAQEIAAYRRGERKR